MHAAHQAGRPACRTLLATPACTRTCDKKQAACLPPCRCSAHAATSLCPHLVLIRHAYTPWPQYTLGTSPQYILGTTQPSTHAALHYSALHTCSPAYSSPPHMQPSTHTCSPPHMQPWPGANSPVLASAASSAHSSNLTHPQAAHRQRPPHTAPLAASPPRHS